MPWTVLLALLTLPEAYRLIRIINASRGTALLHQAQGRTARLHGRVGLLIVVGWLIALVLENMF
jgi:hypothetical protein